MADVTGVDGRLIALRPPPATAPRRVGSIRASRDRLAAALADHEREQRTAAERIAALTLEHEQSVSDLRAAREQHEWHAERLTTERDRLTADLHTAATRLRSCDAEMTRTAAALAEAMKTHAGLRSEPVEGARLTARPRRRSSAWSPLARAVRRVAAPCDYGRTARPLPT